MPHANVGYRVINQHIGHEVDIESVARTTNSKKNWKRSGAWKNVYPIFDCLIDRSLPHDENAPSRAADFGKSFLKEKYSFCFAPLWFNFVKKGKKMIAGHGVGEMQPNRTWTAAIFKKLKDLIRDGGSVVDWPVEKVFRIRKRVLQRTVLTVLSS